MTAFIVATVTIHVPERFAAYGRAITGLSEAHGGTPVVKGPVCEWLEGEGTPGERVVVTHFPDVDAARAYIASPQYQAANELRSGAATVTMRLIEA